MPRKIEELIVQVLVVDDSQAMRVLLRRMLHDLGFEVREASNGREALESISRDGKPELILVDWNMPEMNGLDFVRAVRRELGDHEMPLMMVTTETETSQVVKALAAGASEYLMKPFTKEALHDKLNLLGVMPGPCGKSES
jgi:two-component system chemotaxis response regulator CheY